MQENLVYAALGETLDADHGTLHGSHLVRFTSLAVHIFRQFFQVNKAIGLFTFIVLNFLVHRGSVRALCL